MGLPKRVALTNFLKQLFYWGKIGPKGKHDINTNTYTVLFEDEQYAKNIPRRNIFTHEECVLLWGIKGLPTKLQRMEVRSQDFEKLQLLRRQQPAANPQPVANQQHSSNQQPAAKRQKRFARWDRCYAKWRGGNWYWGRVESVDHRNPEPRYSVCISPWFPFHSLSRTNVLSHHIP